MPLQEKYFPQCNPLPGAKTLLSTLGKSSITATTAVTDSKSSGPSVHLALATSSHSGNFSLKTSHQKELFTVFPQDQQVLGDDPRIPKGRGKPAPDIYLLALKTINEGLARKREQRKAEREESNGDLFTGSKMGAREPDDNRGARNDDTKKPAVDEQDDALSDPLRPILPRECLVFEDSVPGVEAGRRAGMQVVWCPHPGLLKEYEGREELVLAGLMAEHDDEENMEIAKHLLDGHGVELTGLVASMIEEDESSALGRIGRPGKVGDGWARLIKSLEEFPYADYGLRV